MFIAALITIVRTWKQPKCPLTDKWIKMWYYTHTHALTSQEEHEASGAILYFSSHLPQLILKSYFAERQFCYLFFNWSIIDLGLPRWLSSKESTYNAGHAGSIPGLGRSPGGGSGNPLQYSCLENPHEQRSLVGYRPWSHRQTLLKQLSTHTQNCQYLH